MAPDKGGSSCRRWGFRVRRHGVARFPNSALGAATHDIQLQASIVLDAISRNGLSVDQARRSDLQRQIKECLDELRERLRGHGFLPGEKGSGKALQSILAR